MNTITLTALIIIFAGIVLSPFIVLAVIARMPDEEPRHTLDCRDLYRFGLYAADCPAAHSTTHFVSPREHVQFQDSFGGQLNVGESK